MSVIKSEHGETFINAFLGFVVSDLVESFNVGKTMNDLQIVFTVNAIKGKYWFLRSDELKYVFNNAKMGLYGTMYDRIDCAVICGWIDLYLKEREQIVIERNVEQNKDHNKTSLVDFDKKVIESIKKARVLTEIEKRSEEVRKIPEYENHHIHQKWLRQFDFLKRNFEVPRTNGRYIKRYGCRCGLGECLEMPHLPTCGIVNIEDYFKYKAEQLYRVNEFLKSRF